MQTKAVKITTQKNILAGTENPALDHTRINSTAITVQKCIIYAHECKIMSVYFIFMKILQKA